MQCSRKWNWAERQQTCHLVHCPRFESGIRHHLMAAIFSLQPGSKQWAEITVPQRGKAPVWWVCAQIRTAKKLLNLTNISDDRNRDRMRGFQIIIIYLKSFSFLNVLTDVKTSIKNSQWRICFRLVNVIFKILHEHLYCNTTGTLTYPKITQFDTVRITSFFSFVHKYVFERHEQQNKHPPACVHIGGYPLSPTYWQHRESYRNLSMPVSMWSKTVLFQYFTFLTVNTHFYISHNTNICTRTLPKKLHKADKNMNYWKTRQTQFGC